MRPISMLTYKAASALFLVFFAAHVSGAQDWRAKSRAAAVKLASRMTCGCFRGRKTVALSEEAKSIDEVSRGHEALVDGIGAFSLMMTPCWQGIKQPRSAAIVTSAITGAALGGPAGALAGALLPVAVQLTTEVAVEQATAAVGRYAKKTLQETAAALAAPQSSSAPASRARGGAISLPQEPMAQFNFVRQSVIQGAAKDLREALTTERDGGHSFISKIMHDGMHSAVQGLKDIFTQERIAMSKKAGPWIVFVTVSALTYRYIYKPWRKRQAEDAKKVERNRTLVCD